MSDVTTYNEDTLAKVGRAIHRFDPFATPEAVTGLISEIQNEGILFRERTEDTDSASDGTHTFGELYAHRRALTAVLAAHAATLDASWRSKEHHPDDSPMFDGYFIVGIELDTGTITYHYELEYWDDFAATPVLVNARKWDGADPDDTVIRLLKLAQRMAQKTAGAMPQPVPVGDEYQCEHHNPPHWYDCRR